MSVLRARLIGLVVVVSLGAGAALPDIRLDPNELAARFKFESTTLDHDTGAARHHTRAVHRELQRIGPWISSVGAAGALGDVDGNLKPDDLCLVDTRTNEVIVTALSDRRYTPFALVPPPGAEPARTIAPMGCLIADLNEDGLPDLLVYYWGRSPVAFLRIDHGPGTKDEMPEAGSYVPASIGGPGRWFTNAALLADVDGDGHPDLVIGNYFCDEARILDSETVEPACPHPVMQDSMSRAFNGGTNRILLWTSGSGGRQPAVAFDDVQGVFAEQVAHGWTLAIGAQDLDGDGLPDFYFANDFGPDRLLINCSHAVQSFGKSRRELGCFPLQGPVAFRLLEGRRSFTKPRSKVVGQDSFKGMGVEFGDINNDGVPDIYVSNITEKWALQESQFMFVSHARRVDAKLVQDGAAPYTEDSETLGLSRSGWAWDAKLADFDNDGRLEALQAVGFVRGRDADSGMVWRKSCWANLQELATANDVLLKHVGTWFNMKADWHGTGCDLSGNSRRNPFFVMQTSGRYADAAPWLAHLEHGALAPTRGLAIGDVDLDGRLDYVEAKQFAPAEFHHNVSPVAGGNGFIGLSPRLLVGPATAPGEPLPLASALKLGARSRPALGAHVAIRLSDGRTFNREVDGGNGHSGKRSPDIHVGLGHVAPGTTADMVFTWSSPGAKPRSARYTNVPVGTHLFVFLQP